MESLVMNPIFWDNKRVFLTGHTGFKGGWLSLWLQDLGAVVTGFSLSPSTNPSFFNAAEVSDGMNSIIGDIRDLETLSETMSKAQPEIVFHLAAQPLVRKSYSDPVETYSTNVLGLVHLLECARKCPSIRSIVVVTTDKCYQNNEWTWPYREVDALGGFDPYSNSKACAELVTSCYRDSFFRSSLNDGVNISVASARAGNVIGGGDWSSDRLVPDALRAFLNDVPVKIRNPNAIRPWQHVLEPLLGYLCLAEQLFNGAPGSSSSFNFGPHSDDVHSVESVVERLSRLWGSTASWQVDSGSHPHEANILRLDISKALHSLNWRPILTLDKALEMTIGWTKAYLDGQDMKKFSSIQIDSFRRLYFQTN
jgi:CDP-glucose 4,6-dehydratase